MMIENLETRRLMSVSIGTVETTITTTDSPTLVSPGVLRVLVDGVVRAINDAAAQAARRQ